MLQSQKAPYLKLLRARRAGERGEFFEVTVDFAFPEDVYNKITVESIRESYRAFDRKIKLRYTLAIKKKGTIISREIFRDSFSRSWILYWTRDPNITNRLNTNIWVLGVNEHGDAEFFMDLDEAKSFLFSFRKGIRIPAAFEEKPAVYAEVHVRTTKHILLRQTVLAAKSEPVALL